MAAAEPTIRLPRCYICEGREAEQKWPGQVLHVCGKHFRILHHLPPSVLDRLKIAWQAFWNAR